MTHCQLKKIAFIALITLILTGVFAACAGENVGESLSQNTESDTSAEPVETTEDDIPYESADFEGYTFKMLVRGKTYGFWESNEMFAEEINGEPLNDAIYKRISDIEEMYNAEVGLIKSVAAVGSDAVKTIQAGEDAYDMLLGASADASTLATNSALLDLNEVEGLNLDKPWWDQAANDGMSVMNKLYFTTGEISSDRYRATEAILFNKVMLAEYNLDNPYEMVRDGTWTLPKMLEMSQGVSADLDGNGKIDENDKYGMITYTNVVTSGIFASGIHYNTKNESDLPELTFYNERTVNVVEDYITFMTDTELCFDWANYYHLAADPNTNVGLIIFQENRGLFNYNGIHAVPNLRNMFSDFGIVPIPKYDEAQDGYYSCANNVACPFVMIPKTVTETGRAGILTEAMARKGRELTKVAFYDITLKDKASRDEESKEMLDIVFDNMVYDMVFFFNFGD
ncbi:MAG: hypothetical protein PHZ09_10060, partial [Eubacteriales bacterium]|nr:hypothetical protein [Eubacteriales bacterium]